MCIFPPKCAYRFSILSCNLSTVLHWFFPRYGCTFSHGQLYTRGDRIWMSYRGKDGVWRDKTTGLRKNNPIERKDAERLCREQTRREREAAPVLNAGGWEWVDSWIAGRWTNGTAYIYRKHWRKLEEWLKDKELATPAT